MGRDGVIGCGWMQADQQGQARQVGQYACRSRTRSAFVLEAQNAVEIRLVQNVDVQVRNLNRSCM